MGAPQRGIIHSAFDAAANIVFPGDFILSLNAASSSPAWADKSALGTINRPLGDSEVGHDLSRPAPQRSTYQFPRPIPRMPNGLQLTAAAGTFPFIALRAGMPVLFGAQRLHIEAIGCSLDLSLCSQWDPHIERPAVLDKKIVRKNRERLGGYLSPPPQIWQSPPKGLIYFPYIHTLAQFLCGRGVGLTPTGDDMLVGWMAAGWLLYGPMPGFLNACQQIVEVAKRQTHLLSQCWLGYAAEGNVAQPICALLDALTCDNESQLSVAAEGVLAMGATSGHDVIQGMLLMLNEI